MMIVLIIAQEEKSLAALEKLILSLSNKPDQLHSFSSLKDARVYLESKELPDIIFNSVGNDILSFLQFYPSIQTQSALVFIASSESNIASSFLFNTLNFIVGEPKIEDIKFCFDKYKTYFENKNELGYKNDLRQLMKFMSNKEKEYKKRFMVKIGNVIRSVSVEDIAYFFSQDRINYLVKYNGKKFPIDNTLDEVEEMLDPDKFFRANRQFMISIDSISEIHPYFKGRVKLNLNPQQEGDLIISAEKSRSFKDWLDE